MIADVHQRLIALFEGSGAAFRVVEHPAEGRTEVVTQMRGNRLGQAAKAMVVMVKLGKKDRRYLLCVVPGDCRIDLAVVKGLGGGTHAMFAPPAVAEQLTGCVMGAVPPVSFDAELALVVDPRLLENAELVFNAGRLDRSIFIERDAYVAAARPTLAAIAVL
ncbi:YbaK/EbsC family protein [Sorangium sp. So ce406]|uniref:YbaK/EbsC family protein n=1 Tax=Sorangium sp. So ce406 TaxID=3133311 RepID=UPI003F5B5109